MRTVALTDMRARKVNDDYLGDATLVQMTTTARKRQRTMRRMVASECLLWTFFRTTFDCDAQHDDYRLAYVPSLLGIPPIQKGRE